ncbi:MAG: hypothetical protein IPK53_11035 [bacterium]|nr:hypothetical protein [bacterium]
MTPEIIQGALTAEMLRRAFANAGIQFDPKTERNSNVHGQFGTAEGWRNDQQRRQQIQAWLQANAEQTKVVLQNLLAQTNLQGEFENLVDYATNPSRLLQQIDDIVEDDSLHQTETERAFSQSGYIAHVWFPNKGTQSVS